MDHPLLSAWSQPPSQADKLLHPHHRYSGTKSSSIPDARVSACPLLSTERFTPPMVRRMEPRAVAYNAIETSNNRSPVPSRLLIPPRQPVVSPTNPYPRGHISYFSLRAGQIPAFGPFPPFLSYPFVSSSRIVKSRTVEEGIPVRGANETQKVKKFRCDSENTDGLRNEARNQTSRRRDGTLAIRFLRRGLAPVADTRVGRNSMQFLGKLAGIFQPITYR